MARTARHHAPTLQAATKATSPPPQQRLHGPWRKTLNTYGNIRSQRQTGKAGHGQTSGRMLQGRNPATLACSPANPRNHPHCCAVAGQNRSSSLRCHTGPPAREAFLGLTNLLIASHNPNPCQANKARLSLTLPAELPSRCSTPLNLIDSLVGPPLGRALGHAPTSHWHRVPESEALKRGPRLGRPA